MEDMAADFGWSLDDFWEEEPLTPEEEAAQRRSDERQAREEMIGEMYASQFAFDWFDRDTERCSTFLISFVKSITLLKLLPQIPQNVRPLC